MGRGGPPHLLPAYLAASRSWGCRTRPGPRWGWQAGSWWRAARARYSEAPVSGRQGVVSSEEAWVSGPPGASPWSRTRCRPGGKTSLGHQPAPAGLPLGSGPSRGLARVAEEAPASPPEERQVQQRSSSRRHTTGGTRARCDGRSHRSPRSFSRPHCSRSLSGALRGGQQSPVQGGALARRHSGDPSSPARGMARTGRGGPASAASDPHVHRHTHRTHLYAQMYVHTCIL